MVFNILGALWGWIIAHAPQAVATASGVKTIADAAESVKKLAPKLEGKEIVENYANQTEAIMNDETKTTEERQWDVNTRKELVESLVKATAIEASYNIARYAIFATATAFIYHSTVKIVLRRWHSPAQDNPQ